MKKHKTGILIFIFIIAIIGMVLGVFNLVDRNDRNRIGKTESLLEQKYRKGFTYKEMEYYDGEKYYVFSLDKNPDILTRANFKTELITHMMVIPSGYIEKVVYDNYEEKVTEYIIRKYDNGPIDISDMTIKEAISTIQFKLRKIKKEAEEYNVSLEESEIETTYKGKIIYFDSGTIPNSNTLKERLQIIGLPDQ